MRSTSRLRMKLCASFHVPPSNTWVISPDPIEVSRTLGQVAAEGLVAVARAISHTKRPAK